MCGWWGSLSPAVCSRMARQGLLFTSLPFHEPGKQAISLGGGQSGEGLVSETLRKFCPSSAVRELAPRPAAGSGRWCHRGL